MVLFNCFNPKSIDYYYGSWFELSLEKCAIQSQNESLSRKRFISKMFQVFLKNSDNKTELFKMLAINITKFPQIYLRSGQPM